MTTPILVIDANREFGILIRQSLEESGQYSVTLASDAEDAIERAYAEDFELAIIDFGLPDMPGAELVQRLRSIRPELSIVALPGGAETTPDLAGVSVEGVISRPFYLPELPAILQKAMRSQPLTGQIQWEDEEVEFEAGPPLVASEPAPSPPGEQPELGRISADEALNVQLLAALEVSQALACLLLQGGELVAHAGLRADQAKELMSQLRERQADSAASGTVVVYTRLADEQEDRLLYSAPISPQKRVSLLFDASVPFGHIRRAASDFLRVLRGEEPSPEPEPDWLGGVGFGRPGVGRPPAGTPAAEEPATRQEDPGPAAPQLPPVEAELPPAPIGASDQPATQPGRSAEPSVSEPAQEPSSGLHLPPDWLPDETLSAAQQEMLDELTEVDLPPPDPDPAPSSPEEGRDRVSLPRDWIPSEQPPPDYLPFIEESTSSTDGGQTREPSAVAAHSQDHLLSFTTVLVPRFPEHQLGGSLALQVREWTRRFCLAWDWRATQIQVEPDYLVFQVALAPDSAPADAVEQLQGDLSERILSEYPQLQADLPSGRFWAHDYYLSAGDPPTEEQIRAFVERTRRAQGLDG